VSGSDRHYATISTVLHNSTVESQKAADEANVELSISSIQNNLERSDCEEKYFHDACSADVQPRKNF
jgi:hypothetical protein